MDAALEFNRATAKKGRSYLHLSATLTTLDGKPLNSLAAVVMPRLRLAPAIDNACAVEYDDAYIGYGYECEFSTTGDIQLSLITTGAPEIQIIDL